MATFGQFPGVRITVAGGGITGIEIGAEEKLVLVGQGDLDTAEADVNDPTQISSRREANAQFGEDSALARAMREALGNGANINYLYGVMVGQTQSTDNFAAVDSGTLEAPLSSDMNDFVVEQNGTMVDTVERYESPPTSPDTATPTVAVNPNSGEWAASESGDYDFEYVTLEWNDALDNVRRPYHEEDTGVIVALAESEDIGQELAQVVETLRSEYILVSGVTAAEPNGTSADGQPYYDVETYDDSYDSGSMFVVGPARVENSNTTVLGGVGGLFAGNDIANPVYNDPLNGYRGMAQKIRRSEEDAFREMQVIPIRENGSIRVRDNLSTSTESDWERDFWRRRIVDRAVLIAKQVGDRIIGRINDEITRGIAEDIIKTQIEGMVQDRLLEPNRPEDDEHNWFVEVTQGGPNEAIVDIGITPQGIVKRVDTSIVINT